MKKILFLFGCLHAVAFASGAETSFPLAVPLMENADWTVVGRELDVPPGTVHLDVEVGKLQTPAEVGFDDIKVEAIGFVAKEQMED